MQNKLKFSLRLWFIMVLVPVSVFAQKDSCNLSISGTVIDEHDKTPLGFSEIYIEGTKTGTVADENGHYKFSGLCSGRITLVAVHIGCEPVRRTVSLKENLTDFNFYPEHHRELLLEAQVVEGISRESAESKSALSKVELEASRGKSLAESIEQISGVNTLKTGNTIAKPVVHGMYGNRILTLNNGVRQEDQQWGLEHSLNIDPFTAENISVVKGASAVQYGSGAVGGVVIVEPAALPFGERLNGSIYLLGQSNGRGGSSSISLGQGLGENFAYRVQFSGKRLGDLSAPGYNLTNTGVSELNGSAAVGFRKKDFMLNAYYSHFSSELGILRASHIGNLTDLRRALASDEPAVIEPFSYTINAPRQLLSHDLAKLEARYLLNSNTFLKAIYGFQQNRRDEFDIRRGDAAEKPANSLELTTHTADLSLERKHSEKLSGTFGASSLVQQNSNLPGTGVRPILPNYNKYEVGAYAIEKWKSVKWILEAGLRYDYQYTLAQKYDYAGELKKYEFPFSNWAATAGVTRVFNDNMQFSSMLAYAYRPPHVNELLSEGLHHGAAVIEEGDVALTPEKSLNWSNTFSFNYPQKFKGEITAYAHSFDGYIYLRPTSELRLTVRGAFPVHRYTQTNALLMGVDLNSEYYLTRTISYKLRGSFIYGWDRAEDNYLVLMPAPQLTHSFRWTAAKPKSIRNPFVELGQHLKARQNHFPEIENVPDPPSGYHTVFASLGAQTVLFGNALEVSLSAENILNTTYSEYLNRQRYYADEIGFNLLIKIKYQF